MLLTPAAVPSTIGALVRPQSLDFQRLSVTSVLQVEDLRTPALPNSPFNEARIPPDNARELAFSSISFGRLPFRRREAGVEGYRGS